MMERHDDLRSSNNKNEIAGAPRHLFLNNCFYTFAARRPRKNKEIKKGLKNRKKMDKYRFTALYTMSAKK